MSDANCPVDIIPFPGNGLLARLGEQVAQGEQAGTSRIHIDVLNRSQGKGALNG